jgi:hypothetical protein
MQVIKNVVPLVEFENSLQCSQDPPLDPILSQLNPLCSLTPYLYKVHFNIIILRFVRWVPCHHGMARPQVADGVNALQVWKVAVNILNKQSRTADKGWFSSLGVWRGANNSSP